MVNCCVHLQRPSETKLYFVLSQKTIKTLGSLDNLLFQSGKRLVETGFLFQSGVIFENGSKNIFKRGHLCKSEVIISK